MLEFSKFSRLIEIGSYAELEDYKYFFTEIFGYLNSESNTVESRMSETGFLDSAYCLKQ